MATLSLEEMQQKIAQPAAKKTYSLEELQAQISPAAEPEESGVAKAFRMADDFVRSTAQGVTFGFADEISAALNSALETGSLVSPETSAAYNKNLEAERARDREIDPTTQIAGNITGGVMTGAAALPRAMMGGASLAGNMARGAGLGAAGGALAGAGFAEGGTKNRINAMIPGAAMGAAVGGAAPAVASTVGGVVREIAQRLSGSGVDRNTRKALVQLRRALERDQISPDQARAQLRRLGDQGMIADVGGENVRGLAAGAASVPGRAKNMSQRLLNTRVTNQGARLEAALGETLSDRPFNEALSDIVASRSAQAKRLYDAARGTNKAIDSDAVKGLLENKAIQSAIKQARSIDERLKDLPDNHISVLDAAYKRLSGLSSKAKRAGDGTKANALGDLQGRLMDAISDPESGVPVYRRAVAQFKSDSSLIDALEDGRKFLRGDAEVTESALKKMTDGEKEMFAVGAARAIMDKIENAADAADATRKIFGNKAIREKLRAVFPSTDAFRKFRVEVLKQAKFAQTRNTVAPRTGSRTQVLAAEQGDLANEVGQTARDFTYGGTRGAATGLIDRTLGRAANALGGRENPAMADVLFTQGQRPNEQMLQRMLMEELTRKLTGGAGSSGAVGGSVAVQGRQGQ